MVKGRAATFVMPFRTRPSPKEPNPPSCNGSHGPKLPAHPNSEYIRMILFGCYEGGNLAYGKALRKPIGGGLVTGLGNRYCVLSEQCKGSDNRRTTMGAKGGVKELCADRGFKAREGGTRIITLILFISPADLKSRPFTVSSPLILF